MESIILNCKNDRLTFLRRIRLMSWRHQVPWGLPPTDWRRPRSTPLVQGQGTPTDREHISIPSYIIMDSHNAHKYLIWNCGHTCMSKVRIYAKLLENISFYYKDKVYMLIEIMVKQITFIFKWNVHYLPFIFGQIFQENNMQVPVQCIHLLQRLEGILNFLKAMLIIFDKNFDTQKIE